MSDVQFPDRRPHGFQCRDADRWIEPPEQFVIPGPSNQSGPKAVSDEVEFDVRIRASALPILTVDNLGLCRMQFQAALRQAISKFSLEGLGLAIAAHVQVLDTDDGKAFDQI